MPRRFTGSTDNLDLSLGAGGSLSGAVTLAAIFKVASEPLNNPVVLHVGDTTRWQLAMGSDKNIYLTNTTQFEAGPQVLVADGWALVAWTRPSGTGHARWHRYLYSTNTWTHTTGSTNFSDDTPTGTSGIGHVSGGAVSFDGDIAIGGAWAANLTDAQVESLAFSLPAWWAVQPNGLWLLDQAATTQKVIDLSGGGANESGLTGTAVSTNSVPVFSYGAPVVVERVTAVAPPVALSGHGDVATTGWANLTGTHVQITGSGAIADTGRAAEQLTLPIKGHGDVATTGWASLTGTRQQITGHGDIAVTGTASLKASLVVRGQGNNATTGITTIADALALTGKGNIATTGRAPVQLTLDLLGHGNIATTGRTAALEAVALSGHGDIATVGRVSATLTARLSGRGAVSTAGSGGLLVPTQIHLSGSGAVSTTGRAGIFTDTCALLDEQGNEILDETGQILLEEECVLPEPEPEVAPTGGFAPPYTSRLPRHRKHRIRLRLGIVTTSLWSTGPVFFAVEPRVAHRAHHRAATRRHAHEITTTQTRCARRRTHQYGDVNIEVRVGHPTTLEYRRLLRMTLALLGEP